MPESPYFPEAFNCPHCNELLELTPEVRESWSFQCPYCDKLIESDVPRPAHTAGGDPGGTRVTAPAEHSLKETTSAFPTPLLAVVSESQAKGIMVNLRQCWPDPKLRYSPTISVEEESQIRKHCNIPTSERLIVVRSFSRSGSWNDCMAISSHAVYFKVAGRMWRTDLDQLHCSEVTGISFSGILLIGTEQIQVPLKIVEDLAAFLRSLQRSLAGSPAVTSREIPDGHYANMAANDNTVGAVSVGDEQTCAPRSGEAALLISTESTENRTGGRLLSVVATMGIIAAVLGLSGVYRTESSMLGTWILLFLASSAILWLGQVLIKKANREFENRLVEKCHGLLLRESEIEVSYCAATWGELWKGPDSKRRITSIAVQKDHKTYTACSGHHTLSINVAYDDNQLLTDLKFKLHNISLIHGDKVVWNIPVPQECYIVTNGSADYLNPSLGKHFVKTIRLIGEAVTLIDSKLLSVETVFFLGHSNLLNATVRFGLVGTTMAALGNSAKSKHFRREVNGGFLIDSETGEDFLDVIRRLGIGMKVVE